MTFSEKKRLKEDFFEEKVFIRPRSHKSDPFGNTAEESPEEPEGGQGRV